MDFTQEEHDLIFNLKNEFWTDFSKLIAEKLKKVPPHLQELALFEMGESSSVYGSEYDKYMN